MSMESSFIYGYGFELNNNDEKFADFLCKHKDTFCAWDSENKIFPSFKKLVENKDFDKIHDLFEEYDIEHTGLIIAGIMTRETGIRFDYCPYDDSCNTSEAILFSETYPWMLNEKERLLTESELCNICKKYMTELGISGLPGLVEQEYYG